MALAGVLLAIVYARDGGAGLRLAGRIGIIEVQGVIADDADVIDQIRTYRRDASIKGFVVDINSPGGMVGPSQSIYRELRRLREEDERPVIAAIGGIGASGGYYVALGADSIFALPGSLTGSIGVIMEFPDASQLLDKVGLEMQVVKSAEHKDTGSPFRPITEGDRAVLDSLVQDVYRQFVEVVTEERQLDAGWADRVTDGRVLSGRQALDAGLIDRLGNIQDALTAAGRMAGLGDEPAAVRPPEDRFRVIDLLLGRVGTRVIERIAQPFGTGAVPSLKYVVAW